MKGSCWLLLRNDENLKPEQRVKLWDLLEANIGLTTVCTLKDDLKRLWRFTDRMAAQRFWEDWRRRATESGLKPLRQFIERLTPYLGGILAHCDHPLHTSVLEGINNTIKVIKRRAYGYRDDAYFFLQIRATFPGKS